MLMRLMWGQKTEKDDMEAIDKANIVKGTTKRKMPKGMYTEPGGEEEFND
jgi:hypothetical protein